MIECALYGICKKKLEWRCESHHCLEKIFRKGARCAIICSQLVPDDECDSISVSSCTGSETEAPPRNEDTRPSLSLGNRSLRSCEKPFSLRNPIGRVEEPDTDITSPIYRLRQLRIPDRNKRNTSVNTPVVNTRVACGSNPEQLLKGMGYTLADTNLMEVHIYNRGLYQIELSRMVNNRQITPKTIPKRSEAYTHYLIKVFVNTADPKVGDAILNEAAKELEGEIKLFKPANHCFM